MEYLGIRKFGITLESLIELKEKNEPNYQNIRENRNSDKKIKDIILNATEWDDFLSALAVKYGDTVPLYHATTRETAEIIDREGFKLTYGKNYKSFTPEELIYFQIGNSDYQASNRPVVYRLDVPIDFIAEFADIDMDNVDTSDEDLADVGVDMEYFEDMPYEIKDVIRYYVWNNMTIDGMELLITDRNNVGNIFKGLTPVKVSTLEEKVIKEENERENKLMKIVYKKGVLDATMLVGDYQRLLNMISPNEIPIEMKADAIKDYLERNSDGYGLGTHEIGLDPILWKETYDEIHQIEYLGNSGVIVQVWGGHNYSTDIGEYGISYEALPHEILDDIIFTITS
jgi:hypothetical protein